MNYYRMPRVEVSGVYMGTEVVMGMPDTADGEAFEVLHDFNDARGIIVALDATPVNFLFEYGAEDDIVASHLMWFEEHPEARPGRFRLAGGRFEVA